MTQTDAGKFQRRNAEFLLKQRMRLIQKNTGPRSRIRARFKAEAESWSALVADSEKNRDQSWIAECEKLIEAWISIDLGTVVYLDLLTLRSEASWRRWFASAHDQVDKLVSSRYAPTEAPPPEESSLLLHVLSAAEEYETDLVGTPSEWRSMTLLKIAAPERLEEFTKLLEYSYTRIGEEFGRGVYEPDSGAEEASATEQGVQRSVENLVRELGALTLEDLKRFTKLFEEAYGVRYLYAAADHPHSLEVSQAGGGNVEKKDEFDLILEAAGDRSVQVIKVVRELTGLGLAEAKALMEVMPTRLPEALSESEARQARSKLENAGAKVELVPSRDSSAPNRE